MRPRSRRSELTSLALSAFAHALLLAPLAPALWRAHAALPSAPDPWVGGGVGDDEVSVELRVDVPAAPAAPPAPVVTTPPADRTKLFVRGGAAPGLRARDVAEPDADSAPSARPSRTSRPTRSASLARPGAEGRAASSPGAGEEGAARGVGSEAKASPRDLGRAFTRSIGPGSQADAAWGRVPAGWAGTLDVVLDVDESGALAGFQVLEERPAGPLRELVHRSVALLRGGLFAPRGGAPGAGKVRLRLRARTRDVDPSTVAGGRIDLDFTYENSKGRASFTQPGGRRVDVEVDAPKPGR